MSCSSTPLGTFLSSNGGSFHPALTLQNDDLGTSVYASSDLPAHTVAVSCPFDLAVTPVVARAALSLLSSEQELDEHEAMCLYLALHLAPRSDVPENIATELRHQPYVDSLPKQADLTTPLWWTPAERRWLEGSNLAGAVVDRENGWKAEWEKLVTRTGLKDVVEWENYLWACTMLSSRAFPSSLLPPSANPPPISTPILFPGVDTLNHKLGSLVSWIPSSTSLSIVLDTPTPSGSQAFNTYGAKPNEELLLGYGFTTESNPADVVALKLGVPPGFPEEEKLALGELRHFVPRSGEVPEALLKQMRRLMAQEEEEVEAGMSSGWEFVGWENELDVLDAMGGMLEGKLAGLRAGPKEKGTEGRESVWRDVQTYREGQIEVLEAALEWRENKMNETMEKAQEAGVDFGDEEDIEEEDE